MVQNVVPMQNEVPEVKRPPRPFVISKPRRAERFLKLMVYGPYGSGKTRLAASADDVEAMRDVFYIDVEAGDLTLQDYKPDIARVSISNFSQLARIFEYLRVHCRLWTEGNKSRLLELENRFREEPVEIDDLPHYRTVVIDTVSELQALLMYHILGVTIGEEKLDAEYTKSGWDEYDASLHVMRRTIRSFRDLPMHVIFVLGEVEKEYEGKLHMRLPNLTGKLQSELPGFMDVLGYLQKLPPDDKGTVHRRLQLDEGRLFRGKSRLSSLKVPFIDDPTIETLAKAAGIV